MSKIAQIAGFRSIDLGALSRQTDQTQLQSSDFSFDISPI
jgi:hypothetical protein